MNALSTFIIDILKAEIRLVINVWDAYSVTTFYHKTRGSGCHDSHNALTVVCDMLSQASVLPKSDAFMGLHMSVTDSIIMTIKKHVNKTHGAS